MQSLALLFPSFTLEMIAKYVSIKMFLCCNQNKVVLYYAYGCGRGPHQLSAWFMLAKKLFHGFDARLGMEHFSLCQNIPISAMRGLRNHFLPHVQEKRDADNTFLLSPSYSSYSFSEWKKSWGKGEIWRWLSSNSSYVEKIDHSR